MRADRIFRRLAGRLARREDGAGALEFALVAPPLLFLIIGVMQISMALYKGSTVQWVSERALRTAMLDSSVDAARLSQIIETDLAELGEDLAVVIDYQVDDSGAVPVGRVTVNYTYPVVLPLMDTIQARFEVDSSVPLTQ